MTRTVSDDRIAFCSWVARAAAGSRSQEKSEHLDILQFTLISLLSLVVFLALYQFRVLDDNRLSSWQWVFSAAHPARIFAILVVGIVVAYAVTGWSFVQQKPVIFLFFSSFAAITPLWNQPEVIIDASRYFLEAKYLELYGIGAYLNGWGEELGVWTDLPLVPFVYGLLFKFGGESRVAIQLLNTLLFSTTVVLTYLIGSTLWNRSLGWLAGLLLLGMPYLLTQVPLMLVDVPTMFFITLMIFSIIKALEYQGINALVLASFAVVLAMLSKYSTWLMLIIIPVIAICHSPQAYGLAIRRSLAIVFASAVLFSLFIVFKMDVVSEQIRMLINYQWPGLGRWQESHISSLFFQIHPFITLAALVSIYMAVRNRDIKFVIIISLPMLLGLLGIQRLRYLIPVLPMLALMAAYGLHQLGNSKIATFIAATAAIYGIVIASFVYGPFFYKTSITNIQLAGQYLDSLDTDVVEVVTLAPGRSIVNPAVTVPLLDLYTAKTLVYDNDKNLQRPAGIATSALRFTWEWNDPGFYFHSALMVAKRRAIVVVLNDSEQNISGRLAQRLRGYVLSKEFAITDKVFRFQTIIRVYLTV